MKATLTLEEYKQFTIYVDKSFTFKIKTAPTSYLLKKAAKIDKGSQMPGRESGGSVSIAQCKEIAETKMKDLNANDIDAAVDIVKGSARSMGCLLYTSPSPRD